MTSLSLPGKRVEHRLHLVAWKAIDWRLFGFMSSDEDDAHHNIMSTTYILVMRNIIN